MTSTEHYRQVMEALCEITGMSDPAALVDNGQICVDGLDMLLYYDEEFDPERLQIRIDLGEPPRSRVRPEALLGALMVSNYVFGMGGWFVFGVNPQDGHVVLTLQQALDRDTTGQTLLDALQDATVQARDQWKKICDQCVALDRNAVSGQAVQV